MNTQVTPELVTAAANAIREANSVLIGAGAGMGVDSGLPDFRGTEGFWRAYPPFAKLGLEFHEVADPDWFDIDPHLAWGFYGHRMNLYRATTPHEGFHILQRICGDKSKFIFTSNVDGHFQKSGFNSRIVEEHHGSLNHMQCTVRSCMRTNKAIWSAEGIEVNVDESTFRALDPLPKCPHCGALARPNVLMFGDWGWLDDRSAEQEKRYHEWQRSFPDKLVILEFGAGTGVPSVRKHSEQMAKKNNATLIRVNVREAEGPEGTISVPLGALATLQLIEAEMGR